MGFKKPLLRSLWMFVPIACISGCSSTANRDGDLLSRRILAQTPDIPSDLAADRYFIKALQAETTVARRDFVPRRAQPFAGLDVPLAIGWSQTISDPYIVAVMTAAARIHQGSRVLEVGTGSGYQAAILSRLGARVSTIEIVKPLARRASRTLRRLGMTDVATRQGDGFNGWPEKSPFDAIIVTAGADAIPSALLSQLAPGGTLIMPVGPSVIQEQLQVVRRNFDGTSYKCTLGSASFVPLTGLGQTPANKQGLSDRSLPNCYSQPVT